MPQRARPDPRRERPTPWPWRVLGTLVFLGAVLGACIGAFNMLVELPDQLGFYGGLPRWLKVMDDHGLRVPRIWHAAQLTGERDAVALSSAQQCGVVRYYLAPRPVYVLPPPAADLPEHVPAYVEKHRRFLEAKGVQWLIWDDPQPRTSARLFDVKKMLRGEADPGVYLWGKIWPQPRVPAMDYLASCLVLALVVVLGWAVSPLLIRREAASTWLEALPRCFALGLLALYTCFSWPMVLGARLGRWTAVGMGLALVAAMAVLRFLLARRLPRAGVPPAAASARPRRSWVRAAALLLCVLMVLGVTSLALVMPIRNVDAVHHWGYAAEWLHHEGGVWHAEYFDLDRQYTYRRYPLLVPMTLFAMYSAAGHVADQGAKVLFPALFAMILFALHGAMQRERPGVGGLWVVACLATCGSYTRYEGGAVSALGDVPLSFFLLLGLIEWGRWCGSGDRGHLALWVLFLCGAAVTKTEGLVTLGAALAAAALVRRRVRPVPWPRIALALGIVALVALPWYAFIRLLPGAPGYLPSKGSLLSAVPANLAAAPKNLGRFLAEAVNGEHWGILWLLAATAVVTGWGRAPKVCKILVGLAVVQIAAYHVAYLLCPADQEALVMTTRIRLLLHLAPAAAYLAWCLLPRLPAGLEPPRRHLSDAGP